MTPDDQFRKSAAVINCMPIEAERLAAGAWNCLFIRGGVANRMPERWYLMDRAAGYIIGFVSTLDVLCSTVAAVRRCHYSQPPERSADDRQMTVADFDLRMDGSHACVSILMTNAVHFGKLVVWKRYKCRYTRISRVQEYQILEAAK